MSRHETLSISWLAIACLTASAGCAVDLVQTESEAQANPVSSDAMDRMLGGGELSMLHWSLDGIDHDRRYEGVDLTELDQHVYSRIDGVEAGPYVMTLEAVSDDGARTCRRFGRLPVAPGEAPQTLYALLCSPDPAAGDLNEDALFDDCGGVVLGIITEPDAETMTVTVLGALSEGDPRFAEFTARCG